MDINQYIISEDATIKNAMRVINEISGTNVFVCKDGILCATLSDGDIRRHLLASGSLDIPVSKIANYNPIYLYTDDNTSDPIAVMEQHGINALPIVDKDMRLVKIQFVKKPKQKFEVLNIPVIIMAGGKGTRLQPYTQILPKPLIPIGDITITEHIMQRFVNYSCLHFDMIVNYKKNFIKSYFQDNELKRDIDFIEEPEFWGTAGGLKLLSGKYQDTFFVTNCDILVDADYADIYKYHKKQQNIITLVCAKKKVIIPYGTVKVDAEGIIAEFQEKPEYEFLTNTGLYLVEPEFLDYIPENTFIHITDVVKKCMNKNKRVGTYIIEEDAWMDMGQLDELEKMQKKMNSTISV